MIKNSKKEIKRLGDKIRNEKVLSEETLLNLENYRISHKPSLSIIFRELCSLKYQIDKQIIVTYRIKRFESIIRKLHRFPKMNFSRMWDIGGCRCIVKSDEEAYQLLDLIEEKLTVKKINDYIKTPKENGYRGLHLYIESTTDNKTFEIQIRSMKDHNWATLVEISDLLFDSGLKEYEKNKELLEFHKLLSKKEDFNLKEKRKIASITKKYQYLDKLSNVFVRNNLKVREQWLKIKSKSSHLYFLIETSKNGTPNIEAFTKFNNAESEYFEKFKNNKNANIVLTHIPNHNYKKISIAYSNYILTMHSFMSDCYAIIESLITESIKKGRYLDFFSFYDYYLNLLYNRINNSITEIKYSEKLNNDRARNIRRHISKKEREWKNNIQQEYQEIHKMIYNFKEILLINTKNKKIKRFILLKIMKFISWKQIRKLQKTSYNNV